MADCEFDRRAIPAWLGKLIDQDTVAFAALHGRVGPPNQTSSRFLVPGQSECGRARHHIVCGAELLPAAGLDRPVHSNLPVRLALIPRADSDRRRLACSVDARGGNSKAVRKHSPRRHGDHQGNCEKSKI